MFGAHTFNSIAALVAVATAGLAGASPANGVEISPQQSNDTGTVSSVVDKDLTKLQARLSLNNPWFYAIDKAGCRSNSDCNKNAFFDPTTSRTYKKTGDWKTTPTAEETMVLAGLEYDQMPFFYTPKTPTTEGYLMTNEAAYIGLGFATSIVGNSSTPQPWWLSLAPEKLVGLEVARRIASETVNVKHDFGRISFGQVDQSLINGSVSYNPVAKQYKSYTGEEIEDGLWAVTLDQVRVNGQDIVTRHNVSAASSSITPPTTGEPFEKPTMFLSAELNSISLPNETFFAMVQHIPGASASSTGANLGANVPCDTTATISFVFGGVEYPLHPSDWVQTESPSATSCGTIIRAETITTRNEYRLGTQFLGTVYTVLKLAPTPEIGFAKRSEPGPTPGTPATVKSSAVAPGPQALTVLLFAAFSLVLF